MPCRESIFIDIAEVFGIDPAEFGDVTGTEKRLRNIGPRQIELDRPVVIPTGQNGLCLTIFGNISHLVE